MSPTKIRQAKIMEKFDRPDESNMDRMMLMLETLENRLGKVETEQSVGFFVPAPPLWTESVSICWATKDSFHAMKHNALYGLTRVGIPGEDFYSVIRRERIYLDLERRLPNDLSFLAATLTCPERIQ